MTEPVTEPVTEPEIQDGTGHEAVDAAVSAVGEASELPVAQQLTAYEDAHQVLRDVLASIEE